MIRFAWVNVNSLKHNPLGTLALAVHLTGEGARFALHALWNNRLRTFLSLLGITIGIFAVISVFTFVDSWNRKIRSSVAIS